MDRHKRCFTKHSLRGKETNAAYETHQDYVLFYYIAFYAYGFYFNKQIKIWFVKIPQNPLNIFCWTSGLSLSKHFSRQLHSCRMVCPATFVFFVLMYGFLKFQRGFSEHHVWAFKWDFRFCLLGLFSRVFSGSLSTTATSVALRIFYL